MRKRREWLRNMGYRLEVKREVVFWRFLPSKRFLFLAWQGAGDCLGSRVIAPPFHSTSLYIFKNFQALEKKFSLWWKKFFNKAKIQFGYTQTAELIGCLSLISVDGFLLHYLNRFTPFCLPYWRSLRILRFPAVWLDTSVWWDSCLNRSSTALFSSSLTLSFQQLLLLARPKIEFFSSSMDTQTSNWTNSVVSIEILQGSDQNVRALHFKKSLCPFSEISLSDS